MGSGRRCGGTSAVFGRRNGARRTYWFMRLVLPTPLSPSMITFNSTFFRDAIMTIDRSAGGAGSQ